MFKQKQLDPRALQQRIINLATTKPAQKCLHCGSTRFVQSHQIHVVGPIESGLPHDSVVALQPAEMCAACGKVWSLKEEKTDEQKTDGEGSKLI